MSLPAPYLNPDGSKPPGQENRFVFLLPASGDAVVLYPRIREDGSSDPNDLVRVQVELCRHVEPSIVTQARFDPALGVFRYFYTLENGKKARQPAWRWLIENLTDSDSVTVTTPEDWTFQFPKSMPNTSWYRLTFKKKISCFALFRSCRRRERLAATCFRDPTRCRIGGIGAAESKTSRIVECPCTGWPSYSTFSRGAPSGGRQ